MPERTVLAQRIRELRHARGWSQDELGWRMGYAGASPLSHWEAGLSHPRPESIAKLCEALGVEPEALMGEAGAGT